VNFNHKSVAVILTTYNPDMNVLKDNINSYISQCGKLIVCDNSDDYELVMEIEQLCNEFFDAVYLSMNGNKGIACAQNRGVEFAISEGFEFFLEIDQDSKLPSDYSIRILSSYFLLYKNNISIAGIGPVTKRGPQNFIDDDHQAERDLTFVDETLSSGFLYAKSAYQLVGKKDEALFIDYVDWDWCWRAKKLGLNVAVDKSIKIEHVLGEGNYKILWFHVGIAAPIRLYYQYRNSLYIMQKGYVSYWWKTKRFFILALKIPFFFIFADRKKERAYYIKKGVLGFLKKEKGKLSESRN